jgi:hypothetical protein
MYLGNQNVNLPLVLQRATLSEFAHKPAPLILELRIGDEDVLRDADAPDLAAIKGIAARPGLLLNVRQVAIDCRAR